jgi:hypothetical protein
LKITVLPLDSRPCNHSWVKKFAKLSNVNLAIVPEKDSGNLKQGLNFLKYEEWLLEESLRSDYLLVSIDGLVSGGLIQARKAEMEETEAFRRLALLAKIKMHNPSIKILAFDTIMRTSISTTDNTTRVYWEKMNRFSRLKGKLYFDYSVETEKELEVLTQEIPEEIINTYLLARSKKHQVNLKLCELVKEGIIDQLLLLQEDSMDKGMQQIESVKLMNYVKTNHLEEQILLYNGTDEATVVLLGRALLKAKGEKPKVHVLLSDELIKNKIMPFEDRELEINYQNMMNFIGLESVSYSEADYVLALYSEADNVYDLDLESTKEIKPKIDQKFNSFIKKVNQAIEDKRWVEFVDLLYPNGGSFRVLEPVNYRKLLGYSAWNTSSNSLGSALATIAIHAYSKGDLSSFLYERIIDDCFYQTYARREANVSLLDSKVNIYNMNTEEEKEALKLINIGLKKVVPQTLQVNYKISLPWSRTFEIDIDVEVE